MGDYTEHLISMAGGDGEPDLDQIQAPAPVAFHKLNRAQLLTLAIALQDQRDNALAVVRSQQAQIERVEAVHHEGVAYADDIAEGGDEEVPEDYERHYCNEDGEDWPCPTIAALTATEGAE